MLRSYENITGSFHIDIIAMSRFYVMNNKPITVYRSMEWLLCIYIGTIFMYSICPLLVTILFAYFTSVENLMEEGIHQSYTSIERMHRKYY